MERCGNLQDYVTGLWNLLFWGTVSSTVDNVCSYGAASRNESMLGGG